jgi:predicted DNA-binding WGR domain protein
MTLDLYTAGVSETTLSNWMARISIAAQAEGVVVIQSRIHDTPEILQEKFPVVVDNLCSIPNQRIEFQAVDDNGLCPFAYKSYRSRVDQGWNVCLYSTAKTSVFLPFDERLLARRVAHLYYQEGTSDKVYDLYLAQALTLNFYSVISRYGRRGRTLQQTEKVFDYHLDKAEREWNRLHHAKIQKGYQIGRPSPPKQLELELSF